MEDKKLIEEAEKYLELEMDEAMFGRGKNEEELLAKSLVRILKDKAHKLGLNPKSVLSYMSNKI